MERNVNVDDILKALRALRDGHSRAMAYFTLKGDNSMTDFHNGYNLALMDLYNAIQGGVESLSYLAYEGQRLAYEIDKQAKMEFGNGGLDSDADSVYNTGQGGAT